MSASQKELDGDRPGADNRRSPDGARQRNEFGHAAQNGAAEHGGPINLETVLQSVGETAYRWDSESDRICWAPNASSVLGVTDIDALASGRAFALRIDADQAGERYRAVTGGPKVAPNSKSRYRTHFRFLPEGRRGSRSCWVEEIGCCQIGPDGRPHTVQGTLRVIDDWCEKEQRLRFLSDHDELTGQLNRTRLTERLSDLLAGAGREAEQGAFLLVAVNDLSLINESYGFDVGDQVIAIVGRRLARALRGKDCVGRFASNKFGVLLHNCPSQGIMMIARRLMSIVKDNVVETSTGSLSVAISVGAVALPDHASNSQLAIGRTLQALEAARGDRRDHFALYQPSERRESERLRASNIADEIVRALNDRRMALALQPVVSANAHQIAFYECLLRMRKLDGSVLPAGEFMPVAEQFGLAKLLDIRVLELAIELCKQMPDLQLSINVSPAVIADREWLNNFETAAKLDPMLAKRFVVEIAEATAIANLEDMVGFVEALRQLGCKVALDGFGTGYSSFRHLRRLGVDMVKIDASFVETVTAKQEDGYFVRTLVDLARNFGIDTVAEGVTDEETAKTLEFAGVTYLQGYLFGVPELVWPERETGMRLDWR